MIRCPSCSFVEPPDNDDDDQRFTVVQPVLTHAEGYVTGRDTDGRLLVDWYEGGTPTRFYGVELTCPECGHAWESKLRP